MPSADIGRWAGVLSLSLHFTIWKQIIGNEDCLYLSVFTVKYKQFEVDVQTSLPAASASRHSASCHVLDLVSLFSQNLWMDTDFFFQWRRIRAWCDHNVHAFYLFFWQETVWSLDCTMDKSLRKTGA